MKKRKKKKNNQNNILLSFVLLLVFYTCYYISPSLAFFNNKGASYQLNNIPEYQGKSYVILNENKPNFTEEDYKKTVFEKYSNLDILGRCGSAFAMIGKESMPTMERGSIGTIKPSGWQTIKYDFVDGNYLYNRCHLIGYQLTGQNANDKNLITCTRSTNIKGMLEFENRVAEYIKETDHHVLYRVTPLFANNDLVAHGIEMEASSVEDHCKSLCFHVYVYNVEDGVTIDYQTGKSNETNQKK